MHFNQSKRKIKRTKMILVGIVSFIIVVELVALLWLAFTVPMYKKFWLEKANETGEITYLALGDSAAQGIGATHPERGYVGIVGARLEKETGKTVKIVNLSKTGATMDDYLNNQASHAKSTKADIVTIEIGANDISGFNAATYRANFKKVLKTLPSGAYVSNMPLFNSRPASTGKAKEASRIVEEELKKYPKLHFVDLQKQTAQHQSILGFAPDFFHPNDIGYKNWADAFWYVIQSSRNKE